jgi:hypothetical protein
LKRALLGNHEDAQPFSNTTKSNSTILEEKMFCFLASLISNKLRGKTMAVQGNILVFPVEDFDLNSLGGFESCKSLILRGLQCGFRYSFVQQLFFWWVLIKRL